MSVVKVVFIVFVLLVWLLVVLFSQSFFHRSTRLSICATCLSTRSTRLPLVILVCTFVCPLAVSTCPLVVLVVLSVGLFIVRNLVELFLIDT